MRTIAILTSAAAAAMLAGAAFAQSTPSQTPAERATAPGAPSGTIQDEVNNTTQPPRNPDGSVSTRMTTTVTAPADTDTAAMPPASAPSASTMGTNTAATEPVASVGTQVVANAPIPDTPENRRKYGGPESHGGKLTRARGN